ncbi:plasmid pRiA4b ORF-3 family protein [Acetobacter tropicalis]|uniref:plasmid pRiA4b ORF-3 family protein n=1 Tax=Acetobacter tropicalis TaxID=104102 RepID=UPI00397561ED
MRSKSFQYFYDFGDGWEHTVRMRTIIPADPKLSYPRLIEASGTRPPEDSGGPWGFAEKLEALTDPAHEYHESAEEELGEEYDPHAQPPVDWFQTRLDGLAKQWTTRQRMTKYPYVNASLCRRLRQVYVRLFIY